MPKILNLIGQQFGRLTVKARLGIRAVNGRTHLYWSCICVCGKQTETSSYSLRSGNTRSCGCLIRDTMSEIGKRKKPPKMLLNLKGRTFGYLTALEPTSGRRTGAVDWKCICKCGKEMLVPSTYLTNSYVKSCGCIRKDAQVTHGASHKGEWTTEYAIWASIIQRCTNPKAPAYKNYGGRGIAVCERWRSYENFVLDMGNRPEKLTIERIDNDKGYEPSNCRWATRSEQNRNRRNNRLLTFDGKTMCVAAWAEHTGIRAGKIISRLRRGWGTNRTLTTK